jgi:hypothetical protein
VRVFGGSQEVDASAAGTRIRDCYLDARLEALG